MLIPAKDGKQAHKTRKLGKTERIGDRPASPMGKQATEEQEAVATMQQNHER